MSAPETIDLTPHDVIKPCPICHELGAELRKAEDEIERLRGIVVVAKAYAESYLQDEAADRTLCVSGRQHELAQALCQLVKDYP